MKIVVNSCYGGFGLSHEAVMLYAQKKGMPLYPKQDEWDQWTYFTTPEQTYEAGSFYPSSDLERNDPILAEVVEQLGKKADGNYAELRIVEIPDNAAWEIDEYDGQESVREPSRTWG